MKPVETWENRVLNIGDIKYYLEISCRDATDLMNQPNFPLLIPGKKNTRKVMTKALREYLGV